MFARAHGALAKPRERRLVLPVAGGTSVDVVLDAVAQGASIVQVELPAAVAGDVDATLAETIVALATALFARHATVFDDGQHVVLRPDMLGVVCAHVSQVHAVRERLPAGLADVLVETADRFQGMERHVMLVYHPLSGRARISNFHVDRGRQCVMLTPIVWSA